MRPFKLASAATLLVLVLAGPASAQPAPPQAPEVVAKVYACTEIADAAARLACFDAAVGAMKSAQTQGQFAAVDAAGVRQIEREAFGFSLPSLPRLGLPGFPLRREGATAAVEAERTAELGMTIARVGRFDGRPSFVMDNGQVWVTVGNETNRLARAGGKVTIKRASMGSYLMSVDAGGTSLRVRRAE
ncbi:MAG: hypothetical protein ACKVPY_09020 [Paracoccaceae bacterium]